MTRIWTDQLPAHAGERVELAGWVHHVRKLSRVTFLILRDASGTAQIVLDEPPSCRHESVVRIFGTVARESQAPSGVEVRDASVEIIEPVTEQLPVELFRPSMRAHPSTILDHAAVTLRHPSRRALADLTAASVRAFRETLEAERFVEIHTPKIVAAGTEGGANLFRVDYLGQEAFLAQSPQLYKQIAVGAFERVYEVGPVFRAEPHDTARHLNEYTSLDAEMGFIADHHDVMDVAERVIRTMSDAAGLQVGGAFPRISFEDALRVAGSDGDDLAPADERAVCAWAEREHGSEFVFVTGYPDAAKPFYTYPGRSFDLLFRGLEIISGGQRRHRLADYDAVRDQALAAYLEAFRFGMPPHGGFAIGLDRWVMQVCGLSNVREASLFPRDTSRLQP